MKGNMRILIVEDSPVQVAWIKEFISQYNNGMVVIYEIAENLALAIERIEKPGIDVILLDINLPNSQGVYSVVRLFQASLTAPIVVLTADNNEDLELKCMKNGANDYIRKSSIGSIVTPEELIRKLWHAVLRDEVKRDVIAKFFRVQQDIETVKKEITTCKEIIEAQEEHT